MDLVNSGFWCMNFGSSVDSVRHNSLVAAQNKVTAILDTFDSRICTSTSHFNDSLTLLLCTLKMVTMWCRDSPIYPYHNISPPYIPLLLRTRHSTNSLFLYYFKKGPLIPQILCKLPSCLLSREQALHHSLQPICQIKKCLGIMKPAVAYALVTNLSVLWCGLLFPRKQ